MTQAMLLRYGLSHHRAGRLDAAERAYRSVLAEDSQSADALHLLGQVLLRRGCDEDAEALVRRAIEAGPAIALYHNTLGEILRRRGDAAGAEAAYAEALALDPAYAEAWSNRGVLARAEGRLDAAAAHLRRAVAARPAPGLDPGVAAAHNNLGAVLLDRGEPAAAAECFRAALACAPELAGAHANLGNALTRLGETHAALESFARALALDPNNADTEANRAAARADAGDLAGAIAGYRRAVALVPDDARLHHGLGVALYRAGRFGEAIEAFRATLARAPDHLEALINLGNGLVRKGAVEEGIAALERALALDSGCDRAYFSLLAALSVACDWDRLETLARELAARVDAVCDKPERRGAMLPLAFTLPYFSTDIALHRRVLAAVSARVVERVPAAAPRFRHAPGDPDKRLRLGYLSPDFGDHPIGHVTVPVYELHDRARFEVCCYATVDRAPSGGRHFERIRAAADRFIDVSAASAAEIAARIDADRIDILVDLCGFMPGGRPDALALRPAPVQVYWLGHGGGLGAPYIDYLIGDAVVTPPADDRFYVEKIARLPDVFSSADRAAIAEPASRSREGLPEGFVFCAFNNALKIDRGGFDCWTEILAAVPGSVLWLTASREHGVRRRLSAAAAARGVAPERLVFAERIPDKARHLARHAHAGLFLDTFTFNASTTALDALWAGLPVLTVAGPHFHSRIAASYLAAVGLPELIAADRDAYRARAIELAGDREALAALAAKLARNRLSAPLFDGKRFVGHLESAYRAMWRRFCAGLAPASFDVAEVRE